MLIIPATLKKEIFAKSGTAPSIRKQAVKDRSNRSRSACIHTESHLSLNSSSSVAPKSSETQCLT